MNVLRLAALAVMFTLGGCLPAAVIPLHRTSESDYRPQARTVGTLALVGRCLVVEAAGQTGLLVAWPSPGTTWDQPTRTIEVHGTRASVGDLVALGGGEYPLAVTDPRWVEAPAAGCGGTTVWVAHSLTLVEEGSASPK